MFVKRVQKAGKTYAAQYLRLTVVSVVIAAVVTAVVGAVGTPRRISLLPARLGPPFVGVFLQTFVVCFVVGLVGRLCTQYSSDIKQFCSDRLNPLVDRWNGLARRTRAIISGIVTAVVASGITATASVVYALSVSAVVSVGLAAWPVSTYWVLRQPRSTDVSSGEEAVAVRSGYAELRRLETRTIALLVGFVIGTATGGGLWLLGVDTGVMVIVTGVVWLVGTVIVYNRYETELTRRTELAIVGTATTDDEIELTIKNEGSETVDLTNATITDTTRTRHRLGTRVTLQPGATTTVTVPSTFTLSPTTAERTLPLGYTLDRSQETPIIYARTGSVFELQHDGADESPAWTGAESYSSQSTPISEAAHSQD